MNCRIWEFTARTINTRTEEFSGEEQDDCYTENGQTYCRPTGNSFSRKITVNIGARQLESWEKESLKVCLDSEFAPRVDTSGMLYYYTVGSQNNDGFFGARSTVFTLTPGAKKPSNPDSKELSMTFAGITTSGDVHMTLTDNRADYFKGEKITITADGINIPDINSNAPVGDIIDSFVKFNVTNTFDVAGSYDIKLMDVPKPGKYMVTLTFSRTGPNSSGATASTIESFELK